MAGAPAGTIVTAETQTGGRGRQGRSWSSPPGGALLYSAILRPLDQRHLLLPLAVPLAVCDAVEAISADRCRVKWPNDVWIEERKCGGVLIEARPQDGWAVIGVGLNVAIPPEDFPEDLRESAVSVGGGAGVEEALEALNPALTRWACAEAGEILEGFARRDALRGREISWDAAGGSGVGTGVADGIDERGNLVALTPGGERISLGAGEIHLGRT